jgi:hypothetical protein
LISRPYVKAPIKWQDQGGGPVYLVEFDPKRFHEAIERAAREECKTRGIMPGNLRAPKRKGNGKEAAALVPPPVPPPARSAPGASPARRGPVADKVAAHELYLYIANTADLMAPTRASGVPTQGESIRRNLLTKRAKGVYDSTKAAKLWGYLADEGAKRYVREIGGPAFDAATRRATAQELAEAFEAEMPYLEKRATSATKAPKAARSNPARLTGEAFKEKMREGREAAAARRAAQGGNPGKGNGKGKRNGNGNGHEENGWREVREKVEAWIKANKGREFPPGSFSLNAIYSGGRMITGIPVSATTVEGAIKEGERHARFGAEAYPADPVLTRLWGPEGFVRGWFAMGGKLTERRDPGVPVELGRR